MWSTYTLYHFGTESGCGRYFSVPLGIAHCRQAIFRITIQLPSHTDYWTRQGMDIFDSNSHRSIFNSPVVSKQLERVIAKQPLSYWRSADLFPQCYPPTVLHIQTISLRWLLRLQCVVICRISWSTFDEGDESGLVFMRRVLTQLIMLFCCPDLEYCLVLVARYFRCIINWAMKLSIVHLTCKFLKNLRRFLSYPFVCC